MIVGNVTSRNASYAEESWREERLSPTTNAGFRPLRSRMCWTLWLDLDEFIAAALLHRGVQSFRALAGRAGPCYRSQVPVFVREGHGQHSTP